MVRHVNGRRSDAVRERSNDTADARRFGDDLGHSLRVLIATDHAVYDYDWIVRHARLVVDTRNAAAGVKPNRANHALSHALSCDGREGIVKA